jgi:aspartyl protease family protein
MSGAEREQKRMGTGMFVLAWLAFMALLGLGFSDILDRQHNPNQALVTNYADGVREVVLQRNRQGHYLSSGRINGREVVFMLDTGATTIAIPARLASDLDLTIGQRFQTRTANGTADVYATVLDEVSIGDIRLNDVSAAVTPGLATNEVLLGMSFLRNIEFAQRGDSLILRQYPAADNGR